MSIGDPATLLWTVFFYLDCWLKLVEQNVNHYVIIIAMEMI